MKLSRGEKIYVALLHVIMILAGLICLLPVLNVFARSLSSVPALSGGKVWFWPVEFNPEGWKYVLQRTSFLNSMGNSVIITLLGTVLSVFVTILTAYSLSRPYLKGRKVVIYLYVFMMIFNAGILPNYFQIKGYGLLNTRWALILPMVVSPYNTFVLKSNFESVPDSLEEAARIDGADWMTILLQLVLPLSMPIVAVMILYYGVSHWNSYFSALIYLRDRMRYPLQLIMRSYFSGNDFAEQGGGGEDTATALLLTETIKYALIVIASFPMLCLYPFMQRFFVKGVMLGAVKG